MKNKISVKLLYYQFLLVEREIILDENEIRRRDQK